MSKITFDAIHTQTKQKKLTEMMHQSALVCHEITNPNPVLNQCPICQSNNITFHVEKFGFRLEKCNDCEQIFCNPMPSHEQLNSYYNGPMKEFENQFFEESFDNRIPIFAYRIEVITSFIKQGKLLDVGSAIGIFIEALSRAETGLEVHCCEPSDDACKRLQSRFTDITLHNEWLQNLQGEELYDAITLWDTLEHITELHPFCKKIYSLLKPGGFWFFSTPNTDSFEWRIAGKDHVQLLPPGHVNLFNKQSAKILMEQQGFNLVDIKTPNGSLDVSYIEKLITNEDKFDLFIGKFLKEKLKNPDFKAGFAQLISDTTNAGNIFVIVQKPL